MRIALAQFMHESNMFTDRRTSIDAFQQAEYVHGQEVIARNQGQGTYVGGMIDAARDLGVKLVPIISIRDSPGPMITAESFNEIRRDFNDSFRATKQFDAICLSFHGSACAENEIDPEGALLSDLRSFYGHEIPIAASLDIHTNLSPRMIEHATGLFGSNVYPEIDSYDRGREAIEFLVRVVRRAIRPVKAHRYLPMLAQATRQYTGADPARGVLELCLEMEETEGVIDCTVYYGFADADVPFLGTHVLTTTDGSRELAEECAQAVADAIWRAREQFTAAPPNPESAVGQAINHGAFPVVIAESSDNPGGGSAGDATSLLRAMLDRASTIRPAAFASIADPQTVREAQKAGVGGTFLARIGGKSPEANSPPIEAQVKVKKLTDGEYVLSGPKQTGQRMSMGPTALLDIDGIDVIVSSKPRQIFDEEPFRLHGISVHDCKVIGLKSTVHFRAYYEPRVAHVIVASGPGPFYPAASRRRYTRSPIASSTPTPPSGKLRDESP